MSDWKTTYPHTLEQTIAQFKASLPGYWFTIGECQVSADASCGPTKESPDSQLIKEDKRFDSGFHVDLHQPATMAEALMHVARQAILAKKSLETRNKKKE